MNMMLQRYLLNFSYIGTSYLGSQRQLRPNKLIDSRTVQGVLDLILKQLWKGRVSKTTSASRTDGRVHAISSAAHFDFDSGDDCRPPAAEQVTASMNKAIHYYDEHSYLRILKTLTVPRSFHCRHSAEWRSYLYRIAILKPHVQLPRYNASGDSMLPVVERCRCHVAKLFADALNLFNGEHDFATFMASPSKSSVIRTIQDMNVCIDASCPFMNPKYDPMYEDVDFYDVSFTARFFLYKQIRRMVGAAISVASGILTPDEVKFMLDNPAQESWNIRIRLASPDGLFLREVHYDDKDFVVTANDTSASDDSSPTKDVTSSE